MKDDKDPSGSWIRIGMLGLVGRGPETVLVRLGTSHALSDGACLADGCSHLGKGQKTEETSRCVRLRLVGGSAQLTVEQQIFSLPTSRPTPRRKARAKDSQHHQILRFVLAEALGLVLLARAQELARRGGWGGVA